MFMTKGLLGTFLIQLFSQCFGQQASVIDTNLHDQQSVQFIHSLLGNVTVNEDVDQDIDFSEAELQPGKNLFKQIIYQKLKEANLSYELLSIHQAIW